MNVSRRAAITTFARTVALGAASSTCPGTAWAQSFLLDVQQLPDFTPGVLKINLNDFPVLSQPRSSVRLGTAPVASNNTSDETWLKPIIINRGDEDDSPRGIRFDPAFLGHLGGRERDCVHIDQPGKDCHDIESPVAEPVLGCCGCQQHEGVNRGEYECRLQFGRIRLFRHVCGLVTNAEPAGQ